MEQPRHVSVLLAECIENLNIRSDGIYVDGTLGLGGHSYEIASRLREGRLIGIDRDPSAIERAGKRLEPFRDRITLVHGNFGDVAQILDELGIAGVDGMLFDLGVSSPQLDEAERGFSYMLEAPLDMRMDSTAALSAYEVVNTWSEERLNRILWDYGEERYARRITAAILAAREKAPIQSTAELVEIIRGAMPAAALREKQHPANSLEDRIVKTGIARRENGCTCPREAPVCTCGFVRTLRSVSRKPILPSEEEIERNPRSRSAKLRVAERV